MLHLNVYVAIDLLEKQDVLRVEIGLGIALNWFKLLLRSVRRRRWSWEVLGWVLIIIELGRRR